MVATGGDGRGVVGAQTLSLAQTLCYTSAHTFLIQLHPRARIPGMGDLNLGFGFLCVCVH